jgi:hypothetical protein
MLLTHDLTSVRMFYDHDRTLWLGTITFKSVHSPTRVPPVRKGARCRVILFRYVLQRERFATTDVEDGGDLQQLYIQRALQ